MANNDFFNTRPKQKPRTDRGSGSYAGTGSSATVLSISSEILDIAHEREKELGRISSLIATFAVQSAAGNIDSHSTEKVRSNLDSLLKSSGLSDSEAKEVLTAAIVRIIMNT